MIKARSPGRTPEETDSRPVDTVFLSICPGPADGGFAVVYRRRENSFLTEPVVYADPDKPLLSEAEGRVPLGGYLLESATVEMDDGCQRRRSYFWISDDEGFRGGIGDSEFHFLHNNFAFRNCLCLNCGRKWQASEQYKEITISLAWPHFFSLCQVLPICKFLLYILSPWQRHGNVVPYRYMLPGFP